MLSGADRKPKINWFASKEWEGSLLLPLHYFLYMSHFPFFPHFTSIFLCFERKSSPFEFDATGSEIEREIGIK